MRLTVELINASHVYPNPVSERELDLRGHKITGIENLGAAKDMEAIDFTDNDIVTLTNFPLSPKLQTLLCARNRISSLQPSLAQSLPNLHTLSLAQNRVTELTDLDPLQGFTRLTHINLVGNPVASKENYRYYILWRCPSIRFLDFQKVKDVERAQAKKLLGTYEAPTELARSIASVRSSQHTAYSTAPALNGNGNSAQVKLTEKEQERLKALVINAGSLEEVQKLEKAFGEGRLPAKVMHADTMDET